MMILSLIDATNSAIEKLRAHRMPREQRKRLNLLIGRITVFTTGLFASYPTFEDILQSKAGSDHKAPWYTVWDCIGRIAGATVIVSQRFDSNKSHFAELDTLVRRIESRINQDDKEYSNLSQTSRVKLLEQYLRLLDVETKRLHGIHTAARMAIIHARNHPAMLLQKRKKTPSECSGSSGASSYYSCAPDLKLAVPPTS